MKLISLIPDIFPLSLVNNSIINDNWMKNLSDEEKIRAFENAKDWAEQKLSDLSKEGYKYV